VNRSEGKLLSIDGLAGGLPLVELLSHQPGQHCSRSAAGKVESQGANGQINGLGLTALVGLFMGAAESALFDQQLAA